MIPRLKEFNKSQIERLAAQALRKFPCWQCYWNGKDKGAACACCQSLSFRRLMAEVHPELKKGMPEERSCLVEKPEQCSYFYGTQTPKDCKKCGQCPGVKK